MTPETRRFSSSIALASGPPLLIFGWLFLMAGTGTVLLALGVVSLVAGVAFAPTRRRLAASFVGLLIGCFPILFLIASFAVRA